MVQGHGGGGGGGGGGVVRTLFCVTVNTPGVLQGWVEWGWGTGGGHNPKIGENQKWKFSFFSIENNSMLMSFGKKLVPL